jgi:hypothetical protein
MSLKIIPYIISNILREIKNWEQYFSTYSNTCTMHLLLFCTMTKKGTINEQIITLLLHVSTLLCHPKGIRI